MTDSALATTVPTTEQGQVRSFPTLVGILLGSSLCLHLAAVVYYASGATLNAAISVFVGQFLLGLSILRLVDGVFVFQDVRLFFIIFFFLYGGTLPMSVSVFGGVTPGMDGAVFMYATALFGFNFVQWWYKVPWRDPSRAVFDRYQPSFANAFGVFAGFAWILSYAVSRGIPLTLALNRDKVGFIATQLWVVSNLVMNGLVMYMIIGWPRLTRNARVVVVLSVIGFVAFQLSIGNRRDFLAMFIFLAAVVATWRHSVIRLRTVLIGFGLLLAFTLFGVIRQTLENPVLILSDPVKLIATQNEFVSPIQTLIYYVARPHALRFGSTYVQAPLLFIPRAFWPDKPESLSLQFMRDAFGTTSMMGYAYTPVTEALINFGWVGPFLVFSILSLLMVKLVRNVNLRPGLYFLCLSLVVDFNRSDVGGLFYSIICIGAAFWFMHFVSHLRWAPKPFRDTWPATPPAG